MHLTMAEYYQAVEIDDCPATSRIETKQQQGACADIQRDDSGMGITTRPTSSPVQKSNHRAPAEYTELYEDTCG